MAEDEDVDWIFDFVMEVFKSPAWEVPVMSFIDTHCAVFDSEEENKLAYSDVHGQFREMVELLLTQQLAEIGITADDFAKACEVAGRSRDVNRRVLDQILAIDDFRVFKKMMVRRNLQLQLQAVEAMKADVGTHSSVAAAVAASAAAAAAGRSESKGCEQDEEFDEEEDGAAAAADEAVPASVADAEKALAAAEAEKRQLDDAAAATLLELEMRQQQEQMEQQELAAAIEESLRLEAQRQDQQERLESKELDTALEVSAEAAGAEAEAAEAAAAAAAAAAAEEEEEEEGKARKSRLHLVQQQEDEHPTTTTPMSSPAFGASSRKGFREDPADAAAAKDEGAPGAAAAAAAPARAEAKAQPKAAAPGAKAAAAAASVSAAGAKAAAPSLARVGPRQSAFLGAAPLPSIRRPAAPEEDLGAMARRAERVLRTQQADLEGERARQQQLAKKQAEAAAANAAAAEASAAAEAAAQREASEADMARRVSYLRRLRETVVATNDAKRAESASAAQKLEAKSAPDDDGGDAKGVGGGGGAGGGAAEASPADAEAESRRAAMRAALARRMKRDLLKTPAEKMERVYSGQVAALDSKLRDVESARSENKAKQDQAEAQLAATRTAQMRNARRMQQLRTALSNPIEDV